MTRGSAIVAIAIVLVAAPAQASPQDDANYISQRIMSPFCPGVTLQACPSDSAVALRDRITEMAQDGFTRSQIMNELIAEYGPTIRAEPPRSGSGLLAWVLPGIAALGAAAMAWSLVRRWVRIPTTTDGYEPDIHVTSSDKQRLEAELDKLRGPA